MPNCIHALQVPSQTLARSCNRLPSRAASVRRSCWLGSNTPGLHTNGLYRYSRNPQFVGYGLFVFGFLVAWWNALAWIGLLSYIVLAYAVTLVEEEHLTRTYGDSYRAYCQRVPRYLGIPKE